MCIWMLKLLRSRASMCRRSVLAGLLGLLHGHAAHDASTQCIPGHRSSSGAVVHHSVMVKHAACRCHSYELWCCGALQGTGALCDLQHQGSQLHCRVAVVPCAAVVQITMFYHVVNTHLLERGSNKPMATLCTMTQQCSTCVTNAWHCIGLVCRLTEQRITGVIYDKIKM